MGLYSSRLSFVSGQAATPGSTTLIKEGPGLDPYGTRASTSTSTTEAGPGLDLYGHS
jgi:hypothetical protein